MSIIKMTRTALYLSTVQISKLRKLSVRRGISVSELVRAAISDYLEKQ